MRIIICVNMSKNACNILGAFRLASAKLDIKKGISLQCNEMPMICQRFANGSVALTCNSPQFLGYSQCYGTHLLKDGSIVFARNDLVHLCGILGNER